MTTPASRRPCSMVSARLPRAGPRARHARGGLGARRRAPRPGASGSSWALPFGPAGSPGSSAGGGSSAGVPGPAPPAPGAAALGGLREPSVPRSRPRVAVGAGAASVPRSVPSHAALGPLARLPWPRSAATHGAGVGERRAPAAARSRGSESAVPTGRAFKPRGTGPWKAPFSSLRGARSFPLGLYLAPFAGNQVLLPALGVAGLGVPISCYLGASWGRQD